MPKSKHRKKKKPPSGVVQMTQELRAALLQQREDFRKKFGRDMGPGDPVFFDPDAKEPVPWPIEKFEAELFEAMRKAGTPPEIIYAYKKTGGLLLTEESHATPSDRKAWDDAIAEYFELERKAKGSGVIMLLERPLPDRRTALACADGVRS